MDPRISSAGGVHQWQLRAWQTPQKQRTAEVSEVPATLVFILDLVPLCSTNTRILWCKHSLIDEQRPKSLPKSIGSACPWTKDQCIWRYKPGDTRFSLYSVACEWWSDSGYQVFPLLADDLILATIHCKLPEKLWSSSWQFWGWLVLGPTSFSTGTSAQAAGLSNMVLISSVFSTSLKQQRCCSVIDEKTRGGFLK